MHKISFFKKFITCTLAGLVIGATTLRVSFTFLRAWLPIWLIDIVSFLLLATAIIYTIIWQFKKTNNPTTLAFWQGLIRYGVAFDLATFGWEKIFHLQLVMSQQKLNMPFRSLSSQELFWAFFSYSYPFGCIIAGCQIIGALLLLFHRTRLAGVFILLPLLSNILLMDIFYQIGVTVIVHAAIMMLGTLYFLFTEFNRLKEFFFNAKNQLPALHLPQYAKTAIRLSVIYIPLLLIAMRGKPNRGPKPTGQHEVEQIKNDSLKITSQKNK